MSAIANVVIDDSQPTPISHTLVPTQTAPNPKWRDTVAALPISGQVSLAVSQTQRNGLYKTRIVMEVPVMEIASGENNEGYTAAPKIAHSMRVDCVFFAHQRTTLAQREDILELFANSLGNVQVADSINSLVLPY
jgi:hypothetical protein